MKRLIALVALTVLTACDSDLADFSKERSDRLYKSAMEDYRSGRIDVAVDGFKKVVAKDPSNASARFQLACLLQDAKSDYLGAFCGYSEYLSQHPESDKAPLVKERMAKCELELAKFLSVKHGLANKDGLVNENTALKKNLCETESRVAKIEKEAEALRVRVEALTAERSRLLAMVKGETSEELSPVAPSLKEAKDLLEETDDGIDRSALSTDVAALKAESVDELSSGSDLLPPRPMTNVVKTVEKKKNQENERQIPEFYVVQEGDTLYAISKRFYGRLSAWKRIRDMNKAYISSDGRVRVGDTLRLPRQ